jgi:hypothetical protein
LLDPNKVADLAAIQLVVRLDALGASNVPVIKRMPLDLFHFDDDRFLHLVAGHSANLRGAIPLYHICSLSLSPVRPNPELALVKDRLDPRDVALYLSDPRRVRQLVSRLLEAQVKELLLSVPQVLLQFFITQLVSFPCFHYSPLRQCFRGLGK